MLFYLNKTDFQYIFEFTAAIQNRGFTCLDDEFQGDSLANIIVLVLVYGD